MNYDPSLIFSRDCTDIHMQRAVQTIAASQKYAKLATNFEINHTNSTTADLVGRFSFCSGYVSW